MKKIFFVFGFLFSLIVSAQTNGITYQAMIMRPDVKQIPGYNNESTPLINENICIRFSILTGTQLDYQETINTATDAYGMINTIIGSGTYTSGNFLKFSEINWNEISKKLIVEVDFSSKCSNFIEISNQYFTSVPYALFAQNAATPGPKGDIGPEGISSYKIWLNAGNIGTEQGFLNALKGNPGTNGLSAYQIWINEGNTGTATQFLASLQGAQGVSGLNGINGENGENGKNGFNGIDGTNGLSAYQIWLKAGNTGTEAEFLASLQGVKGIQGVAGTNGLSAYQIWLNAGNTGTEAQFLESLTNNLIYSAESKNFTGSIAVGNGLKNLSGSGERGLENTVVGIDAGINLTSGKYNTLIGYMAGPKLSNDQQQIPFGTAYNSATGNVFIGRRAGADATLALDNTIIGTNAGLNLSVGMDNTFMGIWSGLMVQGGSENIGIGHASLMNLAGYGNYLTGNGHRNTAIGDMAARFLNGGASLGLIKTGGKNSLYVGARTTSAGNNVINENVIGCGAEGKGTNTVVIGNNEITQTWIAGKPTFPAISSTTNRPNVYIDPISGELQKISTIRTNGFQDFTPNYYVSNGTFGSPIITKKARYNYDGDTVTFTVDCIIPSKGTSSGTLIITLPIPAAGPWVISAADFKTPSVALKAYISDSNILTPNIDSPVFTTIRISHTDNLTDFITDNNRILISGSYEAFK